MFYVTVINKIAKKRVTVLHLVNTVIDYVLTQVALFEAVCERDSRGEIKTNEWNRTRIEIDTRNVLQ